MGEKTEKATPKKLRDARKKGQVAKSQDFPAAFTFVVSMLTTLAMLDFLYKNLGELLIASLSGSTQPNLPLLISGLFMQSFYIIFVTCMPIMVITALAGILVSFLTTGPTWAPEVFKFDIKKFNPVDNLKNKFKLKTFVELIKSVLKIMIASYLVYGVMASSIPTLIQTVDMPFSDAMTVYVYFVYQVIMRVGIFFVVVAVFDLVYQKHAFNKEMMMEKFEVKQEYKDSEGDPQIKGKRKQIAQEIAFGDSPGAAAKGAKAVVSNPTHIAIALGFDQEFDAAPYILVMGQGYLAERILEVAEENKVPIVRNIPLAHKLWEEGKLYEYVPEDTYEVIAEVLRWISTLEYDLETGMAEETVGSPRLEM